MKKLILFFALASVSNIKAEAVTPLEVQSEQSQVAKNIADGIFSEQFLASLAVLAKQSQAPAKDFLKSSLELSKLSEQQLTELKQNIQTFCEIVLKISLLNKQFETEYEKYNIAFEKGLEASREQLESLGEQIHLLNQQMFEIVKKCAKYFEAINVCLQEKFHDFPELLSFLRSFILPVLMQGVSETATQAIDERITELKEIKA